MYSSVDSIFGFGSIDLGGYDQTVDRNNRLVHRLAPLYFCAEKEDVSGGFVHLSLMYKPSNNLKVYAMRLQIVNELLAFGKVGLLSLRERFPIVPDSSKET